jgi:hypothetical protein
MKPYADVIDPAGNVGCYETTVVVRDYAPMRPGQAITTRGLAFKPSRPRPIEALRHARAIDVALVRSALEGGHWDFRPVAKIAEETGLTETTVREVLESQGFARRPLGRPASNLFTRADRRVTLREVVSSLRAFIAKQV